MKATVLSFGLAATAFANIIFNHVPLKCDESSTQLYHGCLRGQECGENGECMTVETIRYPLSFRPDPPKLQLRELYSTDGSCGPKKGNTICDPNSKAYTGGCCSQYGWCGNSEAHCGTGCISGCKSTTPNPPTTSGVAPRADGLCGNLNGGATCDPKGPYGGCCSQYGFCGIPPGHYFASNGCQNGCSASSLVFSSKTSSIRKTSSTIPLSKPSSAKSSSISKRSSATVVLPTDGQCRSSYSGTTGDLKCPYGGCCSKYGYCGSTTNHCLVSNGCQNGCSGGAGPNPTSSTSGEPVIGGASTSMAPVTQATALATTDGSCGAGNGNTVCGNWPNGNCCSMYGFCGKTSAHCGAGCQSGGCLSAPVIAAPGPSPAPANPSGSGSFIVVGDSGVPAMHAALMPNGRVMFLDKLENYTHLTLPNGRYAMSSEYDPQTNTAVPLGYLTNAFCAGGTFLADGRVVSLGGNGPLEWLDPTIGDGFNAIRYLSRSTIDTSLNGKSWSEPGNKLASNRWYASAQTMPDGSVFVASGSLNGLDPTVITNNNPTYEILNGDGTPRGQNIDLAILRKNQPYYMYPFLHLLRDGTIFIFTSKASQVFNVGSNTVVKELPDLPGDYRTYPNTGGSVLLPLSSANNWEPEVVICGGGAYQDITSPTDPSCGRIKPLSATPRWEMDSMPEGRGMVEGTLLPDGSVLWLNGGNRGAQGFGLMARPTLEALLYNPNKPLGQRWTTLASSNIPRLYHSVAVLLLDGTVMVTGSNPVEMPKSQPDAKDPYVTDFRVEIFVPPYRQGGINKYKPSNVGIGSKTIHPGAGKFTVTFYAANGAKSVKVVLRHGGFITHSVHMGQRLVELDIQGWVAGGNAQTLQVSNPPNHNVTPPGPYVLYVVVDSIPGDGQFIQVA